MPAQACAEAHLKPIATAILVLIRMYMKDAHWRLPIHHNVECCMLGLEVSSEK